MGPSRTLRGMLRGCETDQDGRNVPDAVKDEWTTKRRSYMTPLCKKPPRECTRAEPTRSGRPTNGWDGMPPSHQVLTHNVLNTCTFKTRCFFFSFFTNMSPAADKCLQFISRQSVCRSVYSLLQRATAYNSLHQGMIPSTRKHKGAIVTTWNDKPFAVLASHTTPLAPKRCGTPTYRAGEHYSTPTEDHDTTLLWPNQGHCTLASLPSHPTALLGSPSPWRGPIGSIVLCQSGTEWV